MRVKRPIELLAPRLLVRVAIRISILPTWDLTLVRTLSNAMLVKELVLHLNLCSIGLVVLPHIRVVSRWLPHCIGTVVGRVGSAIGSWFGTLALLISMLVMVRGLHRLVHLV